MYLFFDTETTGLPDYKMPAGREGQPRICQLGAIIADGNGRVKAEVNLLLKPEGWVIPEIASAVHGINQADAEKYGLSIKGVMSIFGRLMQKADTIVAHNLRFDLFLLEIEANRTDLSRVSFDFPKNCVCTMNKANGILRLPPTEKMTACGMTEFKKPNLQEAYRHFFGRDFDGAHDAMADVRACRDIFFAMKKLDATGAKGAAA